MADRPNLTTALGNVPTPDAYLRIKQNIDSIHSRLSATEVVARTPQPLTLEQLQQINTQMSANGALPLNLTALPGIVLQSQNALIPTVTSLPKRSAGLAKGQAVKFKNDIWTWTGTQWTVAVVWLYSDTHANRLVNYPATNYVDNTLFYETDRKVLYINLSGVWKFLTGVMIALLAARPADLGTDDTNFLFIASDTLAFYYWNGTAWASILAGGTGSPVVTQPSGGGSGGLNGQGLPSQGVQPPPGVPLVSVLPGPSDPLSVVGNKVYIIDPTYYYPLVYTFGPPLSGAGDGWWNLDAVESPAIFDTFANLGSHNPASSRVGTVFNATDWKVSYVVQIPNPAGVKTWVYYNGIYENTRANIPGGLGVNDTGFTFRASDYLHNWRWNGTVWHFTSGGTPSGTVLFSQTGAPFGGSGAIWHLLDGATVNQSQDDGTVSGVTLETRANNYIAL